MKLPGNKVCGLGTVSRRELTELRAEEGSERVRRARRGTHFRARPCIPADLAVDVKNLTGGSLVTSADRNEVMFIGAYRFNGHVAMEWAESLGDVTSELCECALAILTLNEP